MYITVCELEGNLTSEDDITREQGEDYVSMLDSALREALPEADITVDILWNTSGYSASPCISADTWQEEQEIEHVVHDIMGSVWMRWCEKHELT
jgi:hypothetical protein